MLKELLFTDTESSHVAFLDEPRTPAGSGRLACALHAVSTSLAEIRNLLEWFGDGCRGALVLPNLITIHVRRLSEQVTEFHEQFSLRPAPFSSTLN